MCMILCHHATRRCDCPVGAQRAGETFSRAPLQDHALRQHWTSREFVDSFGLGVTYDSTIILSRHCTIIQLARWGTPVKFLRGTLREEKTAAP